MAKPKGAGGGSSGTGARAAAPAAVEAQTPLDISQLTTEELQAELARRQAQAQEVRAGGPPVAERTQETILSAFNDMIRELPEGILGGQSSQTKPLIPIHMIRDRVAQKLGSNSATHDHFDAQLKALWRSGKFEMWPINDTSKTSPQDLRNSIQGSRVTFFYLEEK